MKRSQLEHLIRAAGAIGEDPEIVVVGSQAILGQFPDLPASLLVSAEADVFPLNRPERSELIDVLIGEHSRFHLENGYFAQGVDERTAVLPQGWREQLLRICNPNTNHVAGLCLKVHDLALSKYIAGRPKDLEFTRTLAVHGMTRPDTLMERVNKVQVIPELRGIVRARIRQDFAAA